LNVEVGLYNEESLYTLYFPYPGGVNIQMVDVAACLSPGLGIRCSPENQFG
jgi:hypothetical protein